MKLKEFFDLVLTVLKDWHVIATIVVMLFAMWSANFIITYKKKPRKKKKGKTPKEEKPAKPAEEKKEAKEAESTEG